MSYQVLARKWRPANFEEMIGQEHVLQALINALDSERGSCSCCLEIDEGRSVDLIEIDAASRTGVDDMRELLDNVQYAPTRGRFKIYLIDEVHMLSKHSFNALLKTLEEPPPHIKFLLATTDPQKLPVTVLSRCLQFNLKRMSKQQIQSHLQYLLAEEKIENEAGALALLAGAADGSMRDALSLLDQAIAYGGGSVTQPTVETMLGSISREYLFKLFDALLQQDAVAMMREARNIISHNPDYQRICAEMISTEETQLYYQIMLQGRHDLNISPDEAAGFEMLMLRLLAFSPDNQSAKPIPAEKKSL
jgi:DNA polymerase-3 subunit gamma/tau